MKKEEKRKKFHESLIQMLYPPPPPPPQDEDDKHPINVMLEDPIENDELEEEDKSVSSDGDGNGNGNGNDDDECGSKKLTRAQRKRLRKKKLNQAASCRRKLIGPLLPTTTDDANIEEDKDNDNPCKTEPQHVRQNAPENLVSEIDTAGGSASSTRQKRTQRRMAKKLANEKSKLPAVENHDD